MRTVCPNGMEGGGGVQDGKMVIKKIGW
jgi:hypothetical protein